MAGELDFFQQLLQSQQNGAPFLGSTPSFTPGYTFANSTNAMMPNVQAAMGGLTGVGYTPDSQSNASNLLSGVLQTGGPALSSLGPWGMAANLGLQAISFAMINSEAGKALDAERAAKREAERLVEDARRRKEQNLYEAVQVPLQAYERAFREGTAANTQAVEALAQDPRMLVGGIQGVQEATIEGQAKSREALADRIYTDAMSKAAAGMAINQDLAKLDLEEAKGAQIAAMAAEKAKVAQQQKALEAAGGIITQGVGMIGPYGGLSNPGDKIQGLLSGTSFEKTGDKSTQGIDPKMLQAFMQLMGQPK
jgi:hypothetical protein